jgi:opacity protein-like surface antigen
MLKFLALLTTAAAAIGTASAAPDCIENSAGQLVCGEDAAAVRARIAAEDRLAAPGLDRPAGSTVNDGEPQTIKLRGATTVEPVSASDSDCIESAGGEIVCGYEASAVRARQRAEDRISVAQAEAVPEPRMQQRARGSVYSAYGPSIFVRGGYGFDGSGGPDGSFDGPSVSVGYQRYFAEGAGGRTHWGYEVELHYLRDSEDFLILGLPLDVSTWGLSGLVNLRWQYDLANWIMPYASVGVGPGYFHAKADDGVIVVKDGDLTLAYSGRAGFQFPVSDGFSLETGYRFLGNTLNGTPGYHSAEIGLNFDL